MGEVSNVEGMQVIKMYDGFEGGWFDVFGPALIAEIEKEWDKLTKNGTEMVEYDRNGYYAKFPADTKMAFDLHDMFAE